MPVLAARSNILFPLHQQWETLIQDKNFSGMGKRWIFLLIFKSNKEVKRMIWNVIFLALIRAVSWDSTKYL